MPSDKMIILAEGQGPIFADKLRFFRAAPFKAFEQFSRANVPDVPATEFLPPRPVPATTTEYVGEEEPPIGRKAGPAVYSLRARISAVGKDGSSAPELRAGPRQVNKHREHLEAIETRFIPAARRLKALLTAHSKSDSDHGWSKIFDETIPDEVADGIGTG